MSFINMDSTSSLCKGSLIPVKNFHMNAISGGIGMLKNSILYPIFDEIIKYLIPSGIPQYLPIFHLEMLLGTYKEVSENTPKVLNLNDLAFGFLLWLVACSISIAAFACEMLINRLSELTGKYLKLYFILTMVSNRLQRV